MKKIALVELQEHQVVLFGLIDLLLMQTFEVEVFAPEYMWDQLWAEWKDNPKLTWHSKVEIESGPVFFQRNCEQINACDLIVFTTLVRDFDFFCQQKYLAPTILIVHKGNFFFAPHQNLRIQNFKDVLRYLRSIWKRDHFYRIKFQRVIDYCAFLDINIQQYMAPHIPAWVRLLPPIPFSYCDPVPIPAKDRIHVVLPGTVSSIKRNFKLLFEALKLADPLLDHEVDLIFLGNAGTKRARLMFNLLDQQPFKRLHIHTFLELVAEEEYTHHLKKADFLILPLQEELFFGLTKEYYGKTSISAGINDMLRFGKPALLPDFYPLEPALNELTQRFGRAEELAALLVEWVNERTYLSISKKACNELSGFSKAAMSERLMQILKSAFNFIEK